MQTLTKLMVAAALVAAPAFSANAAEYKIDPAHSAAHFTVRHMMVSNVRGNIGGLSGTVVWDGTPASLKVEATLDMSTIDTGVAKRDQDLKGEGFFEVEKFPTMTFKSKRVDSGKDGTFKVVGDLTLHGVTKEVALDVEGPTQEIKNPWGKMVMGASAATVLKRSEFGLTWNPALEAGGYVVGDEVKIQIDLELVKQ